MLQVVFTVLLNFSSNCVESTFAIDKELKFALVSPKNEAPVLNLQGGVVRCSLQPVGFMPFSLPWGLLQQSPKDANNGKSATHRSPARFCPASGVQYFRELHQACLLIGERKSLH